MWNPTTLPLLSILPPSTPLRRLSFDKDLPAFSLLQSPTLFNRVICIRVMFAVLRGFSFQFREVCPVQRSQFCEVWIERDIGRFAFALGRDVSAVSSSDAFPANRLGYARLCCNLRDERSTTIARSGSYAGCTLPTRPCGARTALNRPGLPIAREHGPP